MTFSAFDTEPTPASRIGDDTDYVFGTLLKMSPEEIKRLTDEGVLV
jgi:crotonobetainyl-CoA:carnitine CoA-transferase CaiB-like acyl-CoA transferase